jgi:hypothetical protein
MTGARVFLLMVLVKQALWSVGLLVSGQESHRPVRVATCCEPECKGVLARTADPVNRRARQEAERLD